MSSVNPKISIVIVAYNMQREVPRTLFTLLPPYQKGVNLDDYVIIIIVNGSKTPLYIESIPSNVRLIRIDDAKSSPAEALNYGIQLAKSNLITFWIDGARLASPSLIKLTLLASKLDERCIISTLGFHLGDKAQQFTQKLGYNQQVEDALLSSIKWMENGYKLFNISSFAGSSKRGWFNPIAESNAISLPKKLIEEMRGFDERFTIPGGGLVNLDFFQRALKIKNSLHICLLGEGTFHQFHGGAATNQPNSADVWLKNVANYKESTGEDFKHIKKIDWLHFGKVTPELKKSLAWSSLEMD